MTSPQAEAAICLLAVALVLVHIASRDRIQWYDLMMFLGAVVGLTVFAVVSLSGCDTAPPPFVEAPRCVAVVTGSSNAQTIAANRFWYPESARSDAEWNFKVSNPGLAQVELLYSTPAQGGDDVECWSAQMLMGQVWLTPDDCAQNLQTNATWTDPAMCMPRDVPCVLVHR